MTSVPCQHIADYYHHVWSTQTPKSLGYNLLRQGYKEWAEGRPCSINNLYSLVVKKRAGYDFPCALHPGPKGYCNEFNCRCY